MTREHNRWLSVYALLVYAFLFAPIVVLIIYSFNRARRGLVWQGFTLDWYPKLLANDELLDALIVTLKVAAVAVAVSTVIGALLGLGLARLRFRGRGATETLLLVPVAYIKFDALERMVVSERARAWLGKLSAATIGRLRPASE